MASSSYGNKVVAHDDHEWTSFGCCHCGKLYEVAKSCGNRYCDTCSLCKRKRATDRIKFIIQGMIPKYGMRRKMVTLTIRNQASLSGMVKKLTVSFRKLRNRKVWKNRVFGGLYVIEVTGRPGNWHAHIHIICQSYYLPQKELSKHWLSITKDSFVVWVDNISSADAMRYCTKYLTKPMSEKDEHGKRHPLPDQVVDVIAEELRNNRMFQVFGSFFAVSRKYQKPESSCKQCGGSDWAPEFMIRNWYGGHLPYPERAPPPPLTPNQVDKMAIYMLNHDCNGIEAKKALGLF